MNYVICGQRRCYSKESGVWSVESGVNSKRQRQNDQISSELPSFWTSERPKRSLLMKALVGFSSGGDSAIAA